MVGLAIVIFIFGEKINLESIKAFFAKKPNTTVDNPKVDVIINNTPVPTDVVEPKKVSNVVEKWESLRDQCVDYGLTNSVANLDKVFPTFLDLVQKELTK